MGNPLLSLLPFLRIHAEGKRSRAVFHGFTKDVLDKVIPFFHLFAPQFLLLHFIIWNI
jgi:hypothetical protein